MKTKKLSKPGTVAAIKPEAGKEAKEPEVGGGKAKEPIPAYDLRFVQGFKLALECHPDVESARRLAFNEGVKYIVTLAENFLVEHEKLGSRDDLRGSGFNKLPSWWIATLVTALHYEPPSLSSIVIPNIPQTQKDIAKEPVPFESQ